MGIWIPYTKVSFPDSSLEELDLQSIMGDWVPQDIKIRVLIAARESYTRNQEKMQTLNSKSRSLYTVASGLVNDREETLRGFGRVQTALTFISSLSSSIWPPPVPSP